LEGGFGLWLGDKGIVNGKMSTIFHILTPSTVIPFLIKVFVGGSPELGFCLVRQGKKRKDKDRKARQAKEIKG
jgi:hypothetical protein